MKLAFATLAVTGTLLLAAPAQAAGVCNCCNGQVEDLCKAACEATNSAGAACRPAAFFGDATGIGGERPLNGFSYKGLDLSDASRQELEALRAWLEEQRAKAERQFRRDLRDVRRGKISRDDYAAALQRRDEAVVNYQHGMQGYIAAYRAR